MYNSPAVQKYWQMFSYLGNKLALLHHTNTYASSELLYCICAVSYGLQGLFSVKT